MYWRQGSMKYLSNYLQFTAKYGFHGGRDANRKS